MFAIQKLRADHVIDFAAEELKKYLRMMMPDCGDVSIKYDPAAKDGFRLGLLEDFGLDAGDVEDPVLDDLVQIDTDCAGGILAGSNPRSVLFAVYRFFKENGCRWLYPGIDGEYIPAQQIRPVQYRKLADHRFRGHCNEGAESQQCMLETIDFYAKLEMNVYMLEFDIPYVYYDRYYSHTDNEQNRPPEPVSPQQVLQWKRQCEVEIAKRGLQFHDMGHGWTAEPFGLSSTGGWSPNEDQNIPEEIRQYLAQVSGVRQLFGGVALNTNLCMSNPTVRTTVAKSVADYAQSHSNADYIHVWLADDIRNHCECQECQKMRPSDYYMMIMNELDEELTRRNLATRVVFIAYVDTMFAPEQVLIRNPARFSLLYAPITRSYSSSLTQDSVIPKAAPYVRNAWEMPVSAEENIAHLKAWQQLWHGPCFSYEYHFWRHLYFDPSTMYISRRIYEDIRSLKLVGLDGYVEDGTQRGFFPNGFAVYVFAEALRDSSCDYEAIKQDYFRHVYGDQWQAAEHYLQAISDCFDFAYMSGKNPSYSIDSSEIYRSQEQAQRLGAVKQIAAEGRALALAHMNMPTRPQTVSMRLLLRHAQYCEGLAEAMIQKALGNDKAAEEKYNAFLAGFGAYEFELERYFDHALAARTFNRILRITTTNYIPGEG